MILDRPAPTDPVVGLAPIRTLVDLILGYPESVAAETALIFLDAAGREAERFSHAGLAEASRRATAHLLEEFEPGQPVLLAVEAQADFVLGFCGAVLAGLVPAPMAPLRRRQNAPGYRRLREILRTSDIAAVIAGAAEADWLREALAEDGLSGVRVLSVETLRQEAVPVADIANPAPEAVAYLQYTSGSTSAPKGVVLEHRNVVANLEFMERVFARADEPMRVAGWLPLHHDMGLVGHLLTVLHARGMGVFLPPAAFLARPSLWLDAVHRYRAYLSGAPTFAFELCARKADLDPAWDLSCWKYVFVGSETVSLPVLDRFLDRFSRSGVRAGVLRPVFGLAEATLLAAGGSKGLDALRPRVERLPSGRQLPPFTLEEGVSIRVCDPETGEPRAEGAIGEIWVSGASVSPRYYGETANSGGMGVATGDVGYVRDGSLYITGRRKEVVVIRGQNHSAEDLEFAVGAGCADIAPHHRTACVSEIDDDGERLVVFQEVDRHLSQDLLRALHADISASLVEAFGVSPGRVVFLPAGLMPRTPNNKIARPDCLRRYQARELKVLAEFDGLQRPEIQRRGDADPVVIVGMACRLPGADGPEEYWQNLCSGVDSISEVPPDRWDNDLFYDENPAVPGKVNTKCAGFVDGISLFDAHLFGISPYEAPEIDPQQRLLMETSWRLIENAGWTKARLAKTATGVFVGISTNDYLYSKIKLTPGMATFNAYSGLGNANSIAANRLSYFYDLRGPSVAVDTACSSSLTAFHLGAQAILSDECDQAIVGGVNAILSPGPTITLCQFGMMSPDGRCKTFDARADGYVRAEGCGLVLLKRRSAALADGDRILAVLDASVTGQDGASPGITFPNGAAQNALIARALTRAGLDGAEVSYLEAHGTGTSAGDPVEVEQLRAHYGDGPAASCALGSVKANIGHLEAAAGIASVIKVLLMLEHRKIPPQIHVETLNPKLAIDGTRLHVPRALADWTAEGRRRAAISSFGFGGSLAHVILAEPAEGDRPPRPKPDFAGEHAFPLTVSAPSAEALKVQLRTMSDWLNSFPQISYRDICRTQAAGRSHLRYRSAVLSTSRKGAAEKIDRWLQADHEVQPAAETVATCFLFTGQGEHYLHMGREMYERFPVFRAAFDRCAAAIDGPGRPFPLAELAFRIEDTRQWSDLYMQPILFAVQYALGTLFRACGVVPATVIGHSLGEYAAACLAGCLTPEDAMRILHRRAELIQSLDRVGAMAVVFAPRDAVEAELDGAQAQIAAVNSPGKTVISGHGTEVDRVRELFEARGVESYYLKTAQAFHSHYLDPTLDDFRRELGGSSFSAPDLPWISTLTGEPMTAAPDADYWTRHMREPVLFSRAVAGVGADAFVEIGPGASALAGARETSGRKNALYLRTLNPKKGERTESYFFLDAIGQLYARGAAIRWDPILPGTTQPDRVPGLTFLRRPYWMKGVTAEDFSAFAAHGAGAPAKTPQDAEQGWHYTLEWREIGPVAGPQAGIPRAHNWLIVASPGPLVEALRAEARARGDDLFWLNTDPRGGRPAWKPSAALAPGADAGAWAKALGRIFNLKSRVGVTAWKILFVTGPPLPAADLNRAQARDFGQLIPMLHALRQLAAVSPVWLVTEDAQAPEGADAPNFGDAAVWGFGKTLFLEHPEWRGGMIDLAAADDPAGKARNVLRKVLAPQFESCVALRGDRQFVQQIAPAPLPPARSAAFRGDGVYIVTGGLGGLGLATAEWIVAKGGRRLILLSRRAFPDRTRWHGLAETDPSFAAVGKIRALEEAGAGVEVRALDIRDTDALAALFAELDRDGVPVRGVVHAAGENWFGKVMTLDVPRFLETLRTKTSATWALHRLTADRDLDCFILFSSVSAVWGSVELSHYTAANQVMDILDRRRAAQGLPSLCVDWGPWAEVGMSAMPEERAVLEKLGFSLMPPGRAIAAMETALAADRPLGLIADIDWEKFQVFIDFCLQPSMFADVAIGQERSDLVRPGKLDAILASPPDKAREMIEKVVRMELRSVTLIESTDTIDADQRFNFMGLDSLMALSFAAALESYFRFEVPSTLAYNYPTIRAVTDYLLTELIGAAPGPAAPVPAEPPAAPGWLRPLNDSPGAPTLCCLPYAGSGVSAFRGLAAALAGQVQVTGVQIPGREDHDHVPAFCRMEALIPELVEALAGLDEYVLYGHSMGASIAFELALALQVRGRPLPRALIVSGSNPPAAKPAPHVHELPPEDFVAGVLNTYVGGGGDAAQELALQKNRDLLRADLELFETYRPPAGRLHIPVAAIHSRDDRLVGLAEMRGWGGLTDGDFLLQSIDGGHAIVTERPEDLARCLSKAMSLVG